MKLALVLIWIRDFFGTPFVLNIQRMLWGFESFDKKGRLMGVLPYPMFSFIWLFQMDCTNSVGL